jgi:hypothetical protein
LPIRKQQLKDNNYHGKNQDSSDSLSDIYNYYGMKPDGDIQGREVKKAPIQGIWSGLLYG